MFGDVFPAETGARLTHGASAGRRGTPNLSLLLSYLENTVFVASQEPPPARPSLPVLGCPLLLRTLLSCLWTRAAVACFSRGTSQFLRSGQGTR